jgi:hypothetical protein
VPFASVRCITGSPTLCRAANGEALVRQPGARPARWRRRRAANTSRCWETRRVDETCTRRVYCLNR